MSSQFAMQVLGLPTRLLTRSTVRIQPSGLAALFGLIAFALGCSTTPMPAPEIGKLDAYRVGAPDGLSITILPEPESNFSVVVRPDGMITVPLIGEVPVLGVVELPIAIP